MADDGVWRRGRSRGGRRGGRGGRRSRGGGRGHPLNRIQDGDGDAYMDEPQERPGRYQPYQRESRVSEFSRKNDGGSGSRNLTRRGRGAGGPGHRWHKVTIIIGESQNKDWVVKTLKESVTERFFPQQIHQLGDKLLFFVEESRAAEELKNLGKIESSTGPMSVYVRPSDGPRGRGRGTTTRLSSRGASGRGTAGGQQHRFSQRLDDDDILMGEDPKQVLTQVLGERYKTDSKALNLSDMFHESKFKANGIRSSMYDRTFVESILSIVGEHCPDLLAMDLSKNNIQRLDCYTKLPAECKNLKFLDLSDNKLSSLQDLEYIRGMASVTSISLLRNPCQDQASDFLSYSTSVRKYFPNLECLDGQSLPSPVKFDLPVSSGRIPPYMANYLPNEDAKTLIVNFLEQYYLLYDSDTRERLLEAYSDEALFSVSLYSDYQRDRSLHVYMSKSRNLRRLEDPAKRDSLLKHGRIDIVQFIRDLPRTKHHRDLFEVDIMSTTGSQIAFVVHGVFSEESEKRDPVVRSFTRTFVVAVTGSNNVAILNDLLYITSASPRTARLVQEKVQPSQSGLMPNVVVSPTTSSTNPQDSTVLKLAEATKMNLEYSRRCLVENNWDYVTSLTAFTNLQANNRLPPEAFQH